MVTGYVIGRSSTIALILATIAMASILLLVANIGHITDQEGEGILGPAGNLIASRIAEILFVTWVVLFAYFMIMNFARRRGGGKEEEGGGGFSLGWPLALLILIIFIIVVKLLSGDPVPMEEGGGSGGGGEIIPGSGGEGASGYFTVFITLAIVVVIVLTVIRELRRRSPPIRHIQEEGELRLMIDDAIESLEGGEDPRMVVYNSYLRMCRILEARGMIDTEYMTPGEFAVTAIAQFHLPRDQVEELTWLFEEARYSEHPVGEDMKQRSTRCLRRIREHLDGGRVANAPL